MLLPSSGGFRSRRQARRCGCRDLDHYSSRMSRPGRSLAIRSFSAQPTALQTGERQPISTGRCRHTALQPYCSEADQLVFAGHGIRRACEVTKMGPREPGKPLVYWSGGAMAFRRSGQLIPEPFPTGQCTVTDDPWLLRRGRTDPPTAAYTRPYASTINDARCTYLGNEATEEIMEMVQATVTGRRGHGCHPRERPTSRP
jgi:hypothetical protein